MDDGLIQKILFALIAIGISITLHEFMHGYVAKLLGDTTAEDADRLTLNPIKHIDPFATVLLPIVLLAIGMPPFGAAKPVPVNFARLKYEEFGGALVGLAGPFTNLVLAFIAGLFAKYSGLVTGPGPLANFIAIFIAINVGFFVFNMIPFPPLDGSRVLYAFAPEPLQKLMQTIESFGLIAIGLFIFLIIPMISPLLTTVNQWIFNLVT